MNISTSDFLLLAHAAFGVTGCMAAIWVLVEVLNAKAGNAVRIQRVALVVALCMAGAWICGGYWYVHFYASDKALILKGPWPSAHNLFMETKEHLFFVTAILAILLPFATRERLYENAGARTLVLAIASLIAVTGLAVEGAGAIINHAVKITLVRSVPAGVVK